MLTDEEVRVFEGCLTLPEEYVSATDFEAEEAIKLDGTIKLPESFSLWQWIYKTNYQGVNWSCTSNSTSHWVQILNVKKNWVIPTDKNIITPDWKDLWTKMGHDVKDINDSWDYVEKAVSTALKLWILIEENWELAKFDWYAYWQWDKTDKSIEMMKRYLYNWNPIIWCIRWNKQTWNEITAWEIKNVYTNTTWWHAIALVGWDKGWLWFVNSWRPNDWKGLKSRFYISNEIMKKLWGLLNFRYRVLYIKEDEKVDPEYLKRKNTALDVLTQLKKVYPKESPEIQKAIENLSSIYRKTYKELNEELPK